MVANRSTLRKGKWTAEEEEYTQQIIDYFNEGLVPLPEGVTLRAYLAEKLNCDPMRITKKFTGTHCLGKRLYHAAASTGAAAPAAESVARAHTHLRQLEARFLNRVERSKDADFCGIVELDPAWYNHPNIVSTPAIDALIQQSLHDPNFWADTSDGEEEGECDYDEEESEEGSEAAAGAHDDDDDCGMATPLLFPQQMPAAPLLPAPLSSNSLIAYTAAFITQQQALQQQQPPQVQYQHHQEVKEEPQQQGSGGCLSALPSMASVSDMLFAAAAAEAQQQQQQAVAHCGRMEEGHTDGSESGESGSDWEEAAAVVAAVMVGQKRPRRQDEEAEEDDGGFAQYHDVEDDGPVRPPPALRHFSSSSSTASASSARTLSALSGAVSEEEDNADGHARRMLDVVGRLSKRGSHEDLVSFVCEVSQKQQAQQPQQQQQQQPMVVHCI